MAQRRMFSIDELQADDFLELTPEAQILYVQLSLNADDDGFTSRVKMTQRLCGASDESLKNLCQKGFVHIFDSGVSVIMNWNANNQIKKDRYHETTHLDEKKKLVLNDGGWYKLKAEPDYNLNGYNLDTKRSQNVSNMDTQVVKASEVSEVREVSEVKPSQGKDSLKEKPTQTKKSSPNNFITDELIAKVLKHNNNDVNKATLEFLNSGIPIDTFGKKIHEISKELRSGSKSKVVSLDQIASSD